MQNTTHIFKIDEIKLKSQKQMKKRAVSDFGLCIRVPLIQNRNPKCETTHGLGPEVQWLLPSAASV